MGNVDFELLIRLRCPSCGGAVTSNAGLLCAGCGSHYEVVDGIPVMLVPGARSREDIGLAVDKWPAHWRGMDWEQARGDYSRQNLPHIRRYLPPPHSEGWSLEIGSGPSFLAFERAGQGEHIVALDLDLDVLRAAKEYFARHGREGHFICASIDRLPFKSDVFNLSAGIGVIEHCRDVDATVAELARVTVGGGVTFQTVPLLSALTLITASLRFGTAPRAPLLGDLVRLVHIRLLGARRMVYGYEESFTVGFLRGLFARAGFQKVDAGFYDYGQTVFKRRPVLGSVFYRLIRLSILGMRPFADVGYVRAVR